MVDVEKLKEAIARKQGMAPEVNGKDIALAAIGAEESEPANEKTMLFAGTENDGTVGEYVEAMALKILKHATIRQNMKVKPPGQPPRQMMVDVLIPEALNHVLMVIFSGGEVTDETLTWKPSQVITNKPKLILNGR